MTHTFWLGRDNEQELELFEDGANLELARYDAITRVMLVLRPLRGGSDVTLDGDALPDLFSWGTTGPGRRVMIEGAALEEAEVRTGSYRGRLIVFSADQPTGLVWVDFDEYGIEVRT